MSFSSNGRILRNCRIYSYSLLLSVIFENTIDESGVSDAERTREKIEGVSIELIEDKIRTKLEALKG